MIYSLKNILSNIRLLTFYQDQTLLTNAITAEIDRIKMEQPQLYSKPREFQLYMQGYAKGVWKAHREMSELFVYESIPFNKRTSADPDHW